MNLRNLSITPITVSAKTQKKSWPAFIMFHLWTEEARKTFNWFWLVNTSSFYWTEGPWIGQKSLLGVNGPNIPENIFDLLSFFVMQCFSAFWSFMTPLIIQSSYITWINLQFSKKTSSSTLYWLFYHTWHVHHYSSQIVDIWYFQGYYKKIWLKDRWATWRTGICSLCRTVGDYRASTQVALNRKVLIELHVHFELLRLQQESSGSWSTTWGLSGHNSISRSRNRTSELKAQNLKRQKYYLSWSKIETIRQILKHL